MLDKRRKLKFTLSLLDYKIEAAIAASAAAVACHLLKGEK
jgi:hypothetical protein